eukprot:997240-Rhodomonas_salina.1
MLPGTKHTACPRSTPGLVSADDGGAEASGGTGTWLYLSPAWGVMSRSWRLASVASTSILPRRVSALDILYPRSSTRATSSTLSPPSVYSATSTACTAPPSPNLVSPLSLQRQHDLSCSMDADARAHGRGRRARC